MKRCRTSIDKQENVVSILWQFAHNIQTNPEKGCVATSEDGTRLSIDHVTDALQKIMSNFGYATLTIT
jgi:hypothetical protein